MGSSPRFADYFVICGLDLTSGLEPDLLAGDSLQCTPLDRSYKAKVLRHYPESVPKNTFDKNAVCMLALPRGLQFRTQKHGLEPEPHSFIITREDGSRCYGFSLVFYEPITKRKICSAMHTLQAMHLAELSGVRARASRASSALNGGGGGGDTRSLPRHFKPLTHIPAAASSYYDAAKDRLFVSKAIVLICQFPYAHAAVRALRAILRRPPALEAWLAQLLWEIPVPAAGRSLSFHLAGEAQSVILQRPSSIEEPPLLDWPLRELFALLNVDTLVQLFTCACLEHQVLLCSSKPQRLMLVAEALCALLFPFTWQHVYVPILPASLHHFLDAPVPFVMGLLAGRNGSYNNSSNSCISPGFSSITQNSLGVGTSEANLCLVDLDLGLLQIPEELPPFPHRNELITELNQLLVKYQITISPDPISCGNGRISPLMTSSCYTALPATLRRKHSFSSTSDNTSVHRLAELVRNTGVEADRWAELSDHERYIEDLRFNNAVREVFLNRFVTIFQAYEHFVIVPSQSMPEWLSNRDTLHAFDKATFLSDQPEPHLAFLSRFLESQMFATLVDNKIISLWAADPEPALRVFERRIKALRARCGDALVRTPRYEPCSSAAETQLLLDKRLTKFDNIIPPPSTLNLVSTPSPDKPEKYITFPLIDATILESVRRRTSISNHITGLPWRALRSREAAPPLKSSKSSLMMIPSLPTSTSTSTSSSAHAPRHLANNDANSNPSPALIAHTNWSFVEKLLTECKARTKRMLVEKLGSEAVELGHHSDGAIYNSGNIGDPVLCGGSVSGVEENTLIAALCDLLERVWAHGLHAKHGKSALWAHLCAYQQVESCGSSAAPLDPAFLNPDLSSVALEPSGSNSGGHNSSGNGAKTPQMPSSPNISATMSSPGGCPLRPLPISVTHDMRQVQGMTDIKTQIGYARAWVRLSLEKKLLSRHLKTLLSDTGLLKSLYKRSAFLRCEDEKEQFLYHLLTLNAVDYLCFTNTYPLVRVSYRIRIETGSRRGGSSSGSGIGSSGTGTGTSGAWIAVNGTHADTALVPVPQDQNEFVFQHKNVGVITTLRIGVEPSISRLFVREIWLRDEVTGQLYRFACGRWLGRGVDDDAVERLLVAERCPPVMQSETHQKKPPVNSPVHHAANTSHSETSSPEPSHVLQHRLAECVNAIVKLCYRGDRDRSQLTRLLCAERGLAPVLEQIFSVGFRSARLFVRNHALWDYFLRVRDCLNETASTAAGCHNFESITDEQLIALGYCHLVDAIQNQNESLGWDGKLHRFFCVALRDHLLHRIISPMAACRATYDMYDESSFLRSPALRHFLEQILEPLAEFNFHLERSLTSGVPPLRLHC